MALFKSAVVLHDEAAKGGFRLLMSPWTDLHEEILLYHKVKTSSKFYRDIPAHIDMRCSTPEFSTRPERYNLRVETDEKVPWWTDDIQDQVQTQLRNYIRSCIVSTTVPILLGGEFILGEGAVVENATHCRIISMSENARIKSAEHVRVFSMRDDSKIESLGGASVIQSMNSRAYIGEVWDGCSILSMHDDTVINHMHDSSQVLGRYSHAKVLHIEKNARIVRNNKVYE